MGLSTQRPRKLLFSDRGDLQTDRGNTYILIKCPSTNKSFREMLISEQASPTKDGIYAN